MPERSPGVPKRTQPRSDYPTEDIPSSSRAFRDALARIRRACCLNRRRRWAFGVIRKGGRRRHFFRAMDEHCGRGDDIASFMLPVPSVSPAARVSQE